MNLPDRNWAKRICRLSLISGLFLAIMGGLLFYVPTEQEKTQAGYEGSSQCRSCHEKFYRLWEPSHHAQAMQPYTEQFAADHLKPQETAITVEPYRYRAEIGSGEGYVLETGSGESRNYPILHVLGGKNVYYFLTELERGYLQVLPVAFDVARQQWYDTAASAIRHFSHDAADTPYHWKDRPYTFNTSCYHCHVSQMSKNYDIRTDSYHTQWKEPGINCETCHGPGQEHIRVFQQAGPDTVPADMKLKTITQSRGYTAHQVDSACLGCHAKAGPITAEFVPGDDFFQHYDLVTLEHPDFYPDGRDLGENYTATSWLLSPCIQGGKLDCMYCHTSSGRYRFKGEQANEACLECHAERRQNLVEHTHHPTATGVTQCIQCHMPKTEFGRMIRSDHSMRPPMPAATLEYESPNACTLCHADKDAQWANDRVRQWHGPDYQKPTLKIAGLIRDARQAKWENLPAMLSYLQRKDHNAVFANSLIRLLKACDDNRVVPVLKMCAAQDPSPLVRASAAETLGTRLQPDVLSTLAECTADPYRLVRIRAAVSLAGVPPDYLPSSRQSAIETACEEFIAAMLSRPDDAVSHYNLGNYYMAEGQFDKAIERYEFALRLNPDMFLSYVNAALAHNHLGQNETAEKLLNKAIQLEPDSSAAHLNLALLYGEMRKPDLAAVHFRKTFELDPQSAVAAYNLGVLLGRQDPDQAIDWCRKAYRLDPGNIKYVYTLAYYCVQAGRFPEAAAVLQPLVDGNVDNYQIYAMLGQAYLHMNQTQKAMDVYRKAVENPRFDDQTRAYFQNQIQQLLSN